MKRLTIDVIDEIALLPNTSILQFPTQGIEVEVAAATPADALAVFAITQGKDESDNDTEFAANVEMAARCIVSDGVRIFDSQIGREKLRTLDKFKGIVQRVAGEAMGLAGMNGRIAEKKS